MFSARYASASLFRRLTRSLFFVVLSALMLALLLTAIGLGDALMASRNVALTPLNQAGIDLVVASGTPNESIKQEGPIRLDPTGLLPGERFVRDEFMIDSYWPIGEEPDRLLASDDDVSAVSPVLLIGCSRVRGTSPDTIVVPELTVEPLTSSERTEIERELAQDSAYQAAERELFDLREKQRVGESVDEARKTQLAQRLIELEFDRYPDRFKGIAAEKISPDPVNAESAIFLIVGVTRDDSGFGLLRKQDIVAGSYFSEDTSRTVILESGFAKSESLEVGSIFQLKGVDHLVIGIASPPAGLTSAQVFLPIDELQSLAHVEGHNMALVKTRGSAAVQSLTERIEATDKSLHVVEASNISGALTQSLAGLESILSRHAAIVRFILGLVVLGVVFLAAANSFTVWQDEVWTLSALGWSRIRIVSVIGMEAFMLGAFAVLLGGVIAHGVTAAIAGAGWITEVSVRRVDGSLSGFDTERALIALVPLMPLARSLLWASGVVLTTLFGALSVIIRPKVVR